MTNVEKDFVPNPTETHHIRIIWNSVFGEHDGYTTPCFAMEYAKMLICEIKVITIPYHKHHVRGWESR